MTTKQIIILLAVLTTFFVGVIFIKDISSLDAFWDMFCFRQFGERWNQLLEDSESFNWLVNLLTFPLMFVLGFQILVLIILFLRKELEVVYLMMSTNVIMFSALYLILCVLIP